jgi:hypothetical protein
MRAHDRVLCLGGILLAVAGCGDTAGAPRIDLKGATPDLGTRPATDATIDHKLGSSIELGRADLTAPDSIQGQAVIFDLDTATPALTVYENMPFDQTSDGVKARFSSPQGAAFSIQTDITTGYKLSAFSGHYLLDNSMKANELDIQFDRKLNSIKLVFATADFHQTEIPSTIQLTAYQGTTASTAVGTATAVGTYAGDTMPMGTLSFSSVQPFDLVAIVLPPQKTGTTDFLVDNVTVTLAP